MIAQRCEKGWQVDAGFDAPVWRRRVAQSDQFPHDLDSKRLLVVLWQSLDTVASVQEELDLLRGNLSELTPSHKQLKHSPLMQHGHALGSLWESLVTQRRRKFPKPLGPVAVGTDIRARRIADLDSIRSERPDAALRQELQSIREQ